VNVVATLCDLAVPVLVVLLIVAGARNDARTTVMRTAASLGWVYLLHFADRAFGLWPRMHADLDFSTHTAVAIAIGVTLATLGRGWLIATIALWIGYAGMMIHLGYHSPADLGTTTLAVLPGVVLCQRIGRARSEAGTVGE